MRRSQLADIAPMCFDPAAIKDYIVVMTGGLIA